VLMVVGAVFDRLGALDEAEMPVRTSVRVLVETAFVPMECRCARTAHA
jgi:hypothetical protein